MDWIISEENVPLWRWLSAIDGFSPNALSLYTIVGPNERRINTLAVMSLILEPVLSDSVFKRELFLDSWFAEDSTSVLRVAALSYLSECGTTSDLTIIRKEIDRNDNQTINAAIDAFIHITFRESRERAILALYELQPTTINKSLLSALFGLEAALSTDTLLGGVRHQNSEIRRLVTELLCKRRSLPNDIAEQLLTDSDATVRCAALTSLIDRGRTFSDAEAKEILVKPTQKVGFGLLSAPSDDAGEACWLQYRQRRLRSLNDKELEMIAAEDQFFDPIPQLILADRQFKQRGADLRKAVDDRYKEQFDKWLRITEEKLTGNVDLLGKIRSLEDYLRKDLTRKALDVICTKAEPQDLGRVREALKSGFVGYSSVDVEYLQKFGEWEDIPLIIESLKRPEAGQSTLLLSAPDDHKYQTAARAIYALGQNRLPEILAMPAPSQLLTCLIGRTSDKVFRSLSDVSINLLLRLESDTVRKSAALKCVRSLPKRRIAKLLEHYSSGDEYRYYNVIHWLDFGVSTPRDRALPAVQKVLKKG